MRARKPSCYLVKRCTGRWGFDYIYDWLALDEWQHEVARARTKEECMKKAKINGYAPRMINIKSA